MQYLIISSLITFVVSAAVNVISYPNCPINYNGRVVLGTAGPKDYWGWLPEQKLSCRIVSSAPVYPDCPIDYTGSRVLGTAGPKDYWGWLPEQKLSCRIVSSTLPKTVLQFNSPFSAIVTLNQFYFAGVVGASNTPLPSGVQSTDKFDVYTYPGSRSGSICCVRGKDRQQALCKNDAAKFNKYGYACCDNCVVNV